MHAITIESSARRIARLSGGKGKNLYALAKAGFDVPRWGIVGVDAFRAFRAANALDGPIAALLDGYEPERARALSAEIEGRILAGAMPDSVRAVIRDAYRAAGASTVAVRSSGADEDGASHSFAGQFASELNVRELEAVAESVKRCWASAYSERALVYRHRHGLRQAGADMAVVIQELVPAEKSGVVFTLDPSSRTAETLVISSVFGLGEGLVSGAIDADTLVVDRASGAVRDATVGDKETRCLPVSGSQGITSVEVQEEARTALCLSQREIERLTSVSLRIEDLFGEPQDIEWALQGDAIRILQARPLTSAAARPGAERLLWDNSNIIESYGGVSSQLTFTFARHVYEQVYRDYARQLKVPRHHLLHMDSYLRNMLGYVNGRVYYNLYNWYKVIRLLPFYALNRRVLEISMGLDEALPDAVAESLHPFEARSTLERRLIGMRIALIFAFSMLRIEKYVAHFLRRFYAAYREFDVVDYDRLAADEVYARFRKLEHRLLSEWGRMILLEATIASSYGLLRTLSNRWLPDAPEWFHSSVIRPDQDVESLEPAQRLTALAGQARSDARIAEILRETPASDVYDALLAADREDFLDGVDDYIARFGYRSPNELKLESPDLREDPTPLLEMIRAAAAAPRPSDGRGGAEGSPDRAEAYLDEHLRGIRRWIYERVRRKVTRCLEARERVRFCRTRAFGMSRRMFRAIGRDLARRGVLASDRDVFHMRLEEVRGCFEGTLSHRELRPLIECRKRDEQANLEMDYAPPRFETRGAVYWNGNLESDAWRGDDPARIDGPLRGTPCSPGIARGEAQVVTAPCDVGGRILVTYRTDPGWITALPTAAGLLIERGSPLTHVAIVARELGIPTIIQIKNLTREVKSGAQLRMDGETGTIDLLDPVPVTPEEPLRDASGAAS